MVAIDLSVWLLRKRASNIGAAVPTPKDKK